jgi:DNA topoisomerase-3
VAKELIKTGRTVKPVTGFKSRAGRNFRARLALHQTEEGKWRVEFDEPWAQDGLKNPTPEEIAAAEHATAAATGESAVAASAADGSDVAA